MTAVPAVAPPPGRQRVILATCCLALFITTLDNTVVNVALPAIGRDLGAGVRQLQWVIDAYVLVRGSLLLTAGALGDRLGRRRMFQFGLVGFGIGSLLCSLAPTPATLVVARVVQALGGCFLVPSSLALIAAAFPDPRARARAIGVWGAVTGVSMGLGPVVGGALVQWLGWRSVFWINLPVVAAAVVLAARNVPESRAGTRRALDLRGQAIVLVGIGGLTSGFIEASARGWTSPFVLALLAIGAVALAAFVAVQRRTTHPLLEPALFRSPAFSGAAAVALLAFLVFAGFLFLNTLFLQGERGYSPIETGLLLMPATLGNVFLAPLSGRMTAERGARLPVTLAALAMMAGTLVLAFAGADAPVVLLGAAYLLIGSGVGLVNAPITDAAVAGMPIERAGVAGAVSSMFRQVGTSLGVALLGTITFAGVAHELPIGPAFVDGLHHAYLVAAALSLAAAVVGVLAFGRRPARR